MEDADFNDPLPAPGSAAANGAAGAAAAGGPLLLLTLFVARNAHLASGDVRSVQSRTTGRMMLRTVLQLCMRHRSRGGQQPDGHGLQRGRSLNRAGGMRRLSRAGGGLAVQPHGRPGVCSRGGQGSSGGRQRQRWASGCVLHSRASCQVSRASKHSSSGVVCDHVVCDGTCARDPAFARPLPAPLGPGCRTAQAGTGWSAS